MNIILQEGAEKSLNQLAREQMKKKLLTDIMIDLTICQIEGWDVTEYIEDLHSELERIKNRVKQ